MVPQPGDLPEMVVQNAVTGAAERNTNRSNAARGRANNLLQGDAFINGPGSLRSS